MESKNEQEILSNDSLNGRNGGKVDNKATRRWSQSLEYVLEYMLQQAAPEQSAAQPAPRMQQAAAAGGGVPGHIGAGGGHWQDSHGQHG